MFTLRISTLVYGSRRPVFLEAILSEGKGVIGTVVMNIFWGLFFFFLIHWQRIKQIPLGYWPLYCAGIATGEKSSDMHKAMG